MVSGNCVLVSRLFFWLKPEVEGLALRFIVPFEVVSVALGWTILANAAFLPVLALYNLDCRDGCFD